MSRKLKRVVIWGFPLYSHTHSFIHYGWMKAFTALGYETYWWDDINHPPNVDIRDALVISEGYALKELPIHDSNVYMVNICVQPEEFLERGARIIDIRNIVRKADCWNYRYTWKDKEAGLQKLGPYAYYETLSNFDDLKLQPKGIKASYEALYIYWATDLLPYEIRMYDWIRFKQVVYIGTNTTANHGELATLKRVLEKRGLKFILKNPFKEKVTFRENFNHVVQSIIAPDIRGSGFIPPAGPDSAHLTSGYVPCRIFKHMSYAKAGAINSPLVQDFFAKDGIEIACDLDLEILVEKAIVAERDRQKVRANLEYVKKNHTYVNRVQDLLKALEMRGDTLERSR
jgi:hypothetical protein